MEDNEATDVNKDAVEEKLQRALASSNRETAHETPAEEAELEFVDEKGRSKSVPYDRFAEVNEARREEAAQRKELAARLSATQDKLVRMAELLEAKEEDVRLLNEIKSYVNDPEMKPHVLAIDAKLKGIEAIKEEVRTGQTSPEDALRQTKALIEEAREELRDTQADVQADQLIARADSLAERLLNALPEEYTAEDLRVISDLFTERVDWDAAVAYPERLSEILTQGFQETIDRYGVPRGALFSADEVDLLTPAATEPEQSPEEELAELMELDWGAIRETDLGDGRVAIEPELSDEDFNTVLAQTIRLAHQNKAK